MKTAIIFGANGGIGQAFSIYCLQRFDKVVVCARDISQIELSNDQLETKLISHQLNPTNEQDLAALADSINRQQLSPSLIINACGLLHNSKGLQPEKKIEDFNAKNFYHIIEANTVITPLIAKHLLPLLNNSSKSQQTTGVFASISARVGSISDNYLGGRYSYRASKAALNQIIKTLSIETQRRFKHCAVLALHPGTTDTGLSQPFQTNVPEGKLFTPEFAIEKMMSILEKVSLDDNGKFFAWDGEIIEW